MVKKKNAKGRRKLVKHRSKNNKLNEEDIIEQKIISKGEKIENKLIKKIYSFFHLHLDNYESKHGRRMEGTLFFFNFLAIVLFIFSTYELSTSAYNILVISEFILVSIFIIEYSARMWVAEKKLKHFFNGYSIIDLLAILPILVHFANLSFLRIFRILRLFRMLRILRFQRMFKAKDTMFGKLSNTQLIIIRIILTIFTIVFVSSGLIWTVENKINPGQLGTIWDAMYFAVVTLSTVGYGDVTPLSPIGKIITILMILSGIALIPWQLGKLIKITFKEATKTKNTCSKCGLELHEEDAKYCRKCGNKLSKK